MQKYIDYIKDIGKDTLSNPLWKDNPYLKPLLNGFLNEITYIQYKFFKDQTFDAISEIEKVREIYIFNPVIKHAFNVSNTGIGDDNFKKDILNKKVVSIEHIYIDPCMQDYAFYDGTPVKQVIEELNSLKEQHDEG